jgi:hypothetical protein
MFDSVSAVYRAGTSDAAGLQFINIKSPKISIVAVSVKNVE